MQIDQSGDHKIPPQISPGSLLFKGSEHSAIHCEASGSEGKIISVNYRVFKFQLHCRLLLAPAVGILLDSIF
ncbi:hypothetical protein SDC9_205459 [bioreactor metagenome]|uniref:Uncharacterized protein n=1 Tax=bioreactor metagenome TaxID=1076179 RepID=A0A645J247_9ZZZZ